MTKKETKPISHITALFWFRMKQHPGPSALIVFVALLGVFSVGFVYQRLAIDIRQQAAETASNSYSSMQASFVDNFIDTETNKFSSFANRPWVIQSLQNQDHQQFVNLEKLLTRISKHALENIIVLPNDKRILEGQNYAAREMLLNTQETKKPSLPEAIKLNQQWIVVIVTPILSDQQIYLGAIVTQLDLSPLKNKFSIQNLPGRTELIQKIPGIPHQTIVSTGVQNLAIQAQSPTKLSYWSITFTANQSIHSQADSNKIELYKITGSIAVSFLLIIGILCRYFSKRYPRELSPEPTKIVKQKKQPESEPVDLPQPSQMSSNLSTENTEHMDLMADEGFYPRSVFREYDIRGIYEEQITTRFALQLGKAIGSMALSREERTLITAFDGRLSSPELYQSLEKGILSTGCDVLHIGAMPTPVMNFATHIRKETSSGIIVTASHNPADYNGFKICINNKTLKKEDIEQLYSLMINNSFHEGDGKQKTISIEEDYITAIREDVVPGYGLKIVVDTGNGIAGKIAPRVIQELGCSTIPLHCTVDGSFPNHSPDTSKVENLADLIKAVKDNQADLGIALDGDGDRLVAVSPKGNIIWPDELLMIFARDVLSRLPGADIIFDVKSTRRLNDVISSYSGRPVMCKTGHSNMRNKLEECDAPLAGEYSGHIFFRDRWFGFDDGIYAAARLIEIITTREQTLDEIVSAFEKTYASTEITIAVPDDEKFRLIEKIVNNCNFKEATISTVDGLRADYPKAWGLVRASNTSPALTLRFEANSEQALEHIQSLFKQQMRSIDSRLTF